MGTPLELYDKPDNQFVAGFIGSPSMNFLKGHVRVNGVGGAGLRHVTSMPADAPLWIASKSMLTDS